MHSDGGGSGAAGAGAGCGADGASSATPRQRLRSGGGSTAAAGDDASQGTSPAEVKRRGSGPRGQRPGASEAGPATQYGGLEQRTSLLLLVGAAGAGGATAPSAPAPRRDTKYHPLVDGLIAPRHPRERGVARIVSWNVGQRGLRGTLREFYEDSMAKMLEALDADILCLQETKLTSKTLVEDLVVVPGFSCYHSLNRRDIGYCGTATYCRRNYTPKRAEEGFTGVYFRGKPEQRIEPYGEPPSRRDGEEFSRRDLDSEGRCVMTDHGDFVLLNVYFPTGGQCEGTRWQFKMQLHNAVKRRCDALMRAGRFVVVAGDFNVAHRAVDHCAASEDGAHSSGNFDAAPHRRWMSSMLQACSQASDGAVDADAEDAKFWDMWSAGTTPRAARCTRERGFVDSFRHFYPLMERAYSHWDQASSARETNYGTRIDYILVDHELVARCDLTDAGVRTDVHGSDHAPVWADLRLAETCTDAPVPSNLCAELMDQFASRQQQLSSYLSRATASTSLSSAGSDEVLDVASDAGAAPSLDSDLALAIAASLDTAARERERNRADLPRSASADGAVDSGGRTSRGRDASARAARRGRPAAEEPRKRRRRDQDADGGQASLKSFFTLRAPKPGGSAQPATAASEVRSGGERTEVATRDVLRQSSVMAATSVVATTTAGRSRSGRGEGRKDAGKAWKELLVGPVPPPDCHHGEPCVMYRVKKDGPHFGRYFYTCRRPEGPPSDPSSRCKFWQLADEHRASLEKPHKRGARAAQRGRT